MTTAAELARKIAGIDGRGFKAYKSLRGVYRFAGFELFVDHVQGDPFAEPSKLRLRAPLALARIPNRLFDDAVRRVALEDVLARRVRRLLPRRRVEGSGKSGLVEIDAGGQEVLERTACVVTPDFVEARIELGLPASGRTILGRVAARLLLDELPPVVERGLYWTEEDAAASERFVESVENQEHLRRQLEARRLVAFVADGARLPRASGVSELPLDDAVLFRSAPSLRVRLDLLRPLDGATTVSGMGVPEGVTLVVGGGYHGKSTLLRALERGVYPHVPGDGRELVVTRPDAVAIRAEDGRRVASVDIRPFVQSLPGGRSTESFSSEDASGSTSQAAAIIEALEAGSRLLLIDEDTAATNLMIRDARMQALVAPGDEPIVPFVDRVRELYERHSVSTVLVLGSSGDYFDVADTVIRMRDYLPEEVTAEARRVTRALPTGRRAEAGAGFPPPGERAPLAHSIDASSGRRPVRIDARGTQEILFGDEHIDLRAVSQLVDPSQTRAAGFAIHYAARHLLEGSLPLGELLDRLEATLADRGLGVLAERADPEEHPGRLARPRRFEIAAALNRLRSVKMERMEPT